MARASRQELFSLVCELVGDPPLRPKVVGSGWPGIADVLTGKGVLPVALHVSSVSPHARQPYEKRFQNPAGSAPVNAPEGSIPILVGLARVGLQPVLVAVDGTSRLGRLARFSILFHERLLSEAARDGWAEYVSSSGEKIFAMHPRLFPIFVEALDAKVSIAAEKVIAATVASGVTETSSEEAAERARSFASRLVRSAAFSNAVRQAYDCRCAMCGLGLELVEGAHILPVGAPGSKDQVWNGVALCCNHHAAFDKHYIWVDPASYDVRLRPDVLAIASTDQAVEVFAKNTRSKLAMPVIVSFKPRSAMFEQRYRYFEGLYGWV